jgi:hypothetical protein
MFYAHDPGGDGQLWYDSIYIDSIRARTMVCSGPAWSAKGHCEIQIPSSWSTNSLTINANQGSFDGGDTAYLYIINQNGTVNPNGYPVTIGGGSSDATAPGAPIGLFVS